MRTLAKILTVGIAAGLLTILPFKESKADVSANVALRNKYLATTGALFAEEPVMQPSLTYFNNGFYGVLGANVSSEEGLNEVDYIVGYSRPLNGFNLDIGVGLFDLRNFGGSLNDNTSDAWVKLKKDLTSKSSLEIGVNKNISGGTFSNPKGIDYNLALNYKAGGNFPIEVGTDFHYNDRYFSPDSGLSVAQLSASYPFSLGGFTFTPKARLQKTLDKKNFRDNSDLALSISQQF